MPQIFEVERFWLEMWGGEIHRLSAPPTKFSKYYLRSVIPLADSMFRRNCIVDANSESPALIAFFSLLVDNFDSTLNWNVPMLHFYQNLFGMVELRVVFDFFVVVELDSMYGIPIVRTHFLLLNPESLRNCWKGDLMAILLVVFMWLKICKFTLIFQNNFVYLHK